MSTVNANAIPRTRRAARYTRRAYRAPYAERLYDSLAVTLRRLRCQASQPMSTAGILFSSLALGTMLAALLIAALLG